MTVRSQSAEPAPGGITKWAKRWILGARETIAGTVYGTIIILAVLAADARTYEHHLWQLGALATMSAIVLWVAHVYAHGLGESLTVGRRLTLAEVTAIARREVSVVLAAVPPVAAILAGSVGLLDEHAAYRVATALGIGALSVQGIRYARLEKLSLAGTVVTVVLNLVLGVTIVVAEVWVAH